MEGQFHAASNSNSNRNSVAGTKAGISRFFLFLFLLSFSSNSSLDGARESLSCSFVNLFIAGDAPLFFSRRDTVFLFFLFRGRVANQWSLSLRSRRGYFPPTVLKIFLVFRYFRRWFFNLFFSLLTKWNVCHFSRRDGFW